MTSLPIKLLVILFCSSSIMAEESAVLKDLYTETSDALMSDPVAFEPDNQELIKDAHESFADIYHEDEVAIVPEVENRHEEIEDVSSDTKEEPSETEVNEDVSLDNQKIINAIIVEGNKNVPLDAILNRIPYHISEVFTPVKSKILISNLFDMGYFSDVELKGELVDKDKINLYIIVREKKLLKEVIFKRK